MEFGKRRWVIALLLFGCPIVTGAKPPLYGTVSLLSSAPLTSKRISRFDAGYGAGIAGYAVVNSHVHLGCRVGYDRWFYYLTNQDGREIWRDCSHVTAVTATMRLVRTMFSHKGTYPTRVFFEWGAGLFHFDRTERSWSFSRHENSWRGGVDVGAGVQLSGRRALWFELVPMFHLVQSPAGKPYHYFSANFGFLFGNILTDKIQ